MKYPVYKSYHVRLCLCFLLFSFTSFAWPLMAQHLIWVDAGNILNDVSGRPIGINMNYLMDGTYLSANSDIKAALKEMNVKFLRYPGGEKSDNYLWSTAPWTKAAPVVARPGSADWPSKDVRFTRANFLTLKSNVLDFDEFMALSRSIGAEPILVVAYDCMYKHSAAVSRLAPTKEKLLKSAEEWVRYANIKKKYGVKYWMIGNESYKNCDYNGCATAAQYRDDIIEFSRRMKKVDPDIKIIANGEDARWWATVLSEASAHIDYLGLSNYPVWNYTSGYDYYRTNNPDFMEVINTASDAINALASPEDRERIKIMVTEFNAIDWSAGWENKNDLGHALFCFEMLGQHLNNPLVVSSNFWNTRWVTNATANYQVSDALNKNGKLNANGKILALWGNYLLPKMISTTSTEVIRTFACMDPQSQKLNLFLINKENTTQQISISLLKYLPRVSGKRWEFVGTGAEDVSPALLKKENFEVSDPVLTLQVPAISITILEFTEVL
jgi:hypothetical protein